MRVLLDECVPIQIKSNLVGHEVRTVGRMGWAGKKNGELLKLAAPGFDVFVTVDRGLKQQQNLAGLTVGVVTLVAHSNEIEALRPLIPRLRHALRKVKPGQVIRVGG
jgi:hypothetical protein